MPVAGVARMRESGGMLKGISMNLEMPLLFSLVFTDFSPRVAAALAFAPKFRVIPTNRATSG